MVLRCPEVDGPSKPPPTEATADLWELHAPVGPHAPHALPDKFRSQRPPRPPSLLRLSSSSFSSTSTSTSSPNQEQSLPFFSSRPTSLRNRPKKPETNEPSAPTKQRDHRQNDRKAAGGGAPVDIRAGSVTRSLRSRVGARRRRRRRRCSTWRCRTRKS